MWIWTLFFILCFSWCQSAVASSAHHDSAHTYSGFGRWTLWRTGRFCIRLVRVCTRSGENSAVIVMKPAPHCGENPAIMAVIVIPSVYWWSIYVAVTFVPRLARIWFQYWAMLTPYMTCWKKAENRESSERKHLLPGLPKSLRMCRAGKSLLTVYYTLYA